MRTPSASIIIPTRRRPGYLATALDSIEPQAEAAGSEVIVVDDDGGKDARVRDIAERHGARLVSGANANGANAARNAGIAAARGDLLVLVDDDVRAPPGWLAAMLAAAEEDPDAGVLGGPIRAVLDGGGPAGCGRERPPITTLDLGPRDRDAPLVWSANMAIHRGVFERIGPFDESLRGRGEEEDWELRHRAAGGRIRYVAAAGLDHRRTAADARLLALARAGYELGRSARRFDTRKRAAPTLIGELRVVVGNVWHVLYRRCPLGIVSLAHAVGRLREALVP